MYDVIVIGAGAVGENAAGSAARLGRTVAVVEQELVGGECSYWACMPSKTLLNPGKLLEAVRRAPGAREVAGENLDAGATLERRNKIVHGWDDSAQVKWLDGQGVHLLRGRAQLAGERLVEVTDATGTKTPYEAAAVVVATGSTPEDPGIDGMQGVRTWTSRDITSADEVPRRLILVGGGAVGVEMAQAWAWLGSEVTLIHNSPLLLKTEEPFVGEELKTALEKSGVRVATDAETTHLRTGRNGSIVATVEHADGRREELESDEVVVATGRRGRTQDLGLETVGLDPGRFLAVDPHMRVEGVEGGWLYAVGDVNGRALFTHMGKYQGRIAGAHIGGIRNAAVSDIPAIPRVFFTSPEIAAVGLTEAEAREAGMAIDTVTHDISQIAAASILGRGYVGTCKLIIDRRRQILVGATFVGPSVGELLHSATIAIVGQVPLDRLWHAVPSFPTFSEVWLRLLENHRDAGWDPYPSP